MDIEQARINMVKQQIRAWDVTDDTVLDVISKTPRENFVPEQYKSLAFADMQIPLGEGEIMLTPKEEARILQQLAVKDTDVVLEIGTGSGYFTALLAHMAKSVISVDINPAFMTPAAQKLSDIGITNATLTTGNGAQGWDQLPTYDVIVITGGLPYLPNKFKHQLNLGGRIFAILGQGPAMNATLLTKVGNSQWQEQKIFETMIPMLKDGPEVEQFNF